MANAFLNHKQSLLDAGELSPRTWAEYKRSCDELVSGLGKILAKKMSDRLYRVAVSELPSTSKS